MKATDFTRGMTVHSNDGTQIGRVMEVWAETPSHGHLPMSRHHLKDYGPIKGTGDLFATEDGYLHVREGGVFNPGRDLFVPLSAVRQIDARTAVRLSYPAAMCCDRFASLPQQLSKAA